MAKNNTNKIVWLAVIGFVLAWAIAGFTAGLTSNLVIGIAMFVIMFSGVFGKKPMETVSSFVPIVAIAYMLTSSSFGDWWQWLISVLVALFVGNALSNFRPDYEKEYANYKHKLKYSFTSKEEGFSVSFPKKPQEIDSEDYSRQYVSKDKGAVHSVTVYDLANKMNTKAEVLAMLESSVARVCSILGIEPYYEIFELDGLPSAHFSIERDNGTTYYYTTSVKDDKTYDVALSVRGGDDDMFVDFINSFRFLGKRTHHDI